MEKLIYLEDLTSMEQDINVEDKAVKVIFSPFRNEENNKPEGIIAVIQDITERVKLNNMRKEFVADVSHELKTPITSIMGYADTLLEGDYDQETQKEFLQVIASEARRMARLVTDLLDLSRIDSNKKKIKKTSFDLGELAKECQKQLAIEIKKKEHHVECFVTADVPPVYADKDDIQRVILNILTNSIKYTPNGGKIKIYVGFVYSDAYIKIIDNGIGIPEEDLNRIFERFYRVDKARTREMGGTGLGLSIAKEILDKNGGSIDIKSEVNKGTEVVIKIPTK
jgi:two-component system sensor histidine kinase VicK